ncbi:8168_t:CDS:2, partial [Ambispora leptoticha]
MKARRRIQDEDDDQEEIYKDDRVHEEKNDDESKVDNIAPLPPRKTYDLISPPKASSIISASSSSITAPGRDYKSFFGAATKSKTIVANKRRTAPKIDDTERL